MHLLHNSPIRSTLGSNPGDKKGGKCTNKKLFTVILVILQALPSCSYLPAMDYFSKFQAAFYLFPRILNCNQRERQHAVGFIHPGWNQKSRFFVLYQQSHSKGKGSLGALALTSNSWTFPPKFYIYIYIYIYIYVYSLSIQIT